MDAAVNGTVYERELKLILAGNEDKLGKVGWIREDVKERIKSRPFLVAQHLQTDCLINLFARTI